jgi:hypothetical protein
VEESAYIGTAAAGLVYFVLGARLVRLGIRTRSATEKLLGLTFLIWTLTYVFLVIAIVSKSQPALESQFYIASHIATNVGEIGLAYFTLLAFRRGSTWAQWLFAIVTICLVVGTAGSIWVGDPGGVKPLTNAWWWCEWIGETATTVWIGAEGLHHYGTSRRRVRLGLCEPIVSHRYLLWGLAGVFWTLLGFVSVGHYVEFWATHSWSANLDNLVGFCEIAALVMIWLAYFAPAAYQRKINASAVLA